MEQEIKRGEELFAQGRREEAEKLFMSLLKKAPHNAEILNNLGVICHASGRSREAEIYLSSALEIKPAHKDALLNLASLQKEAGRWEDSIHTLEKAVGALKQSLVMEPNQQSIGTSLLDLEQTMVQQRSQDSFKILFVQEAPCIRNYKMACALKSLGHRVSLAYTRACLSQVYPALSDDIYSECIQLRSHREFWDLSRDYDIIHCHNEPDAMTVAALAGDVPVVHDTHDLISLRNASSPMVSYLEGIANRGADGRVYVSSYQRDCAHRLYGFDLHASVVVHNYVSRHMIPEKTLHKLSSDDGEFHVVYEGGLGGSAVPHRYYLPLFKRLADQGIHVHMFPSFHNAEYEQAARKERFLHYHDPISPDQIILALSQYDFGIIPFTVTKENQRHLHSAMPNKLFEYLAAGLPVIARDLYSLREFLEKYEAGFLYSQDEEIVPRLKEAPRSLKKDLRFVFEEQASHIEKLYRTLLDEPARKKRRASYAVGDGKDVRASLSVRRAFHAAVQEGGSEHALEILDSHFERNPPQFMLRPVAGTSDSRETCREEPLPGDPYFVDIPALSKTLMHRTDA